MQGFLKRLGGALFFFVFLTGPLHAQQARIEADGTAAILSAADAGRYAEIFAVQEGGDWVRADALIAELESNLLMGHVLFQRYMHPTAYRSSWAELRDWMAAYADHPEAERIYNLALKRKPAGAANPRAPIGDDGSLGRRSGPGASYDYISPRQRSASQAQRVREIKQEIRRNVYRTYLSKTESNLESAEWRALLDEVEIDEGYARVAAAWLYYGEPQHAWELAHPAAERSGHAWPLAHWYAGLAGWRLGLYSEASAHFEAAAQSNRLSDWNKAAAAYWASRASLKNGEPQEMSRWLQIAAAYPRTFYGLLAGRALGLETVFTFADHTLSEGDLAQLAGNPYAARAIALLQVGDEVTAGEELMLMKGWNLGQMPQALLALAESEGLPQIAFRLGARLTYAGAAGEDETDAALYPLPPWEPPAGWLVDRALVYAFMRQESAFDPNAESHSGARGLMQLMPGTAAYVSGDDDLAGRRGRNRLFDPALNLELGQAYLDYLLRYSSVQGDLFRLAAAYNGGPGNLEKWDEHVNAGDDPLLFIEILPSLETRLFIERVLANLWIYRARLGQEAPSLTDIASGQWPRYHHIDGKQTAGQ